MGTSITRAPVDSSLEPSIIPRRAVAKRKLERMNKIKANCFEDFSHSIFRLHVKRLFEVNLEIWKSTKII